MSGFSLIHFQNGNHKIQPKKKITLTIVDKDCNNQKRWQNKPLLNHFNIWLVFPFWFVIFTPKRNTFTIYLCLRFSFLPRFNTFTIYHKVSSSCESLVDCSDLRLVLDWSHNKVLLWMFLICKLVLLVCGVFCC